MIHQIKYKRNCFNSKPVNLRFKLFFDFELFILLGKLYITNNDEFYISMQNFHRLIVVVVIV